MESLCWTCARAYAKPDPEGCGFHRREHEQVFDAAKTYDRVNAAHEPMKVVLVTKCQHYDRESRKPSPKIEAPRPMPTHSKREVELKTHCKRGHPFSKENTYITTQGSRECRKCRAMMRKEKRQEGMG